MGARIELFVSIVIAILIIRWLFISYIRDGIPFVDGIKEDFKSLVRITRKYCRKKKKKHENRRT